MLHRVPMAPTPLLYLLFAILLFLLISNTTLQTTTLPFTPIHIPPPCPNAFFLHLYLPSPYNPWPCVVRAPASYHPPYALPSALWTVPRTALGPIDISRPPFNLYFNHQRWAAVSSDNLSIILHEHGGTAGRAFSSNFEYARHLLHLVSTSCPTLPSSHPTTPPLLLDMGGGIGSVAAALADSRGAAGKLRALTYVLPHSTLFLQSVIAARRLPAYVTTFNGSAPFPDASFHVVHCKWCWHHLIGLRSWLVEVDRLLTPGGFFVFTFTKRLDEMIDEKEWNGIVDELHWQCSRKHKIVLVCQKEGISGCEGNVLPPSSTLPLRDIMRPVREAARHMGRDARVLTLDVPSADVASGLELALLRESSFVMHVMRWRRLSVAETLLKRRHIAILHPWHDAQLPVYPRTFDAVFVGCEFGRAESTVWADMHRVLRPGGVVVLLQGWCDQGVDAARIEGSGLFRMRWERKEGRVAMRLEV